MKNPWIKTLCDDYQDVPEKHMQQEIGDFGGYIQNILLLLWHLLGGSSHDLQVVDNHG